MALRTRGEIVRTWQGLSERDPGSGGAVAGSAVMGSYAVILSGDNAFARECVVAVEGPLQRL